MHRLHLHVSVPDLAASIRFYEALFGAPPSVIKDDYAKWMLDDPRVNFAISMRGSKAGLDHLGIQVESRDELTQVYSRMAGAGQLLEQGETTCCYAQSEKGWVHDPSGVAWEAFHTVGEATQYGDDTLRKDGTAACCVPAAPKIEKVAAGAEACCEPAADGASGCCAPPPSTITGGVLNRLGNPRP